MDTQICSDLVNTWICGYAVTKWIQGYVVTESESTCFRGCFKVAGYSAVKPTYEIVSYVVTKWIHTYVETEYPHIAYPPILGVALKWQGTLQLNPHMK